MSVKTNVEAERRRVSRRGSPPGAAWGCASLLFVLSAVQSVNGEPVDQLANPGFEAPYGDVSGTNSYGSVGGAFPHAWTDNSRSTGRHTDNFYARETVGTVSGSALRASAAVQAGYSSGANLALYQTVHTVSGRLYSAGIWLKSDSNATVTVALRQPVSPYSSRVSATRAVGTAWTRVSLSLTPSVSEPLVFEVKCAFPVTLWIDEAECAVADGRRAWFVAPAGSDDNPGSLDAPFRTLACAVTNLNAGDTLFLRAGTYRETLQPPQSGVPGSPITVTAYNGETATLSGCDALAGPWAPASNGIYAANAAWTLGPGYNQLFADGVMQHEARHPDHGADGLLYPVTASLAVASNHTVSCSAFDGKGDLTGARFYAGVGSSWAWQTALVASNKTGTLYLDPASASTWWWPNYAAKSTDTGRGFLYGHPRLLDADGEWLLQTNTVPPHTVLLRLAGGGDPTDQLIELKRRSWCVDLNGRTDVIVSNLSFRAGALRLNGTGLTLDGCDARHLSHYLTFRSGSSSNGDRTEGGGIVVSGTSNIVRRCTVAETAGSGLLVSGAGHTLTRTHVFNTDYSATYAACLVLSGTGHTATFNTLHDTGRDILRPTGKGLSVLYNDLYYAGRLCKDLGAVYAWGTNAEAPDGTHTRIAYNWVHDSTPTDPLSMGIYIDNYSRNFQIDHNVIWDFGDQAILKWSDGNRLNSPADGIRLYHNTLFRCLNYNTGTYTAYQPGISAPPDAAYWTNGNHHLFYSAFNNLYMTNSATELEDAASRDFRPKAGSLAIDPLCATNTVAWSTTNGVQNVPASYRLAMRDKNQPYAFSEQGGSGVPLDADGNGSPDAFTGLSPDSGAYERGAPYWVPGINGWPAGWPGVRAEPPLSYVGTVVTAKGTLLASGGVPATVFLHWGPGGAPHAWTNVVCLGDAFTGSFDLLLFNLADIRLYTAYGYQFHATNALGETWSEPVTFTTGSGLAQSRVWDAGAGTNLAIGAAGNWDGFEEPELDGATHATFGSGGATALVNRAVGLYGITFTRNASFTLATGGGSVTLRSLGIAAAAPTPSSRTYTVATDLILADQQVWAVTNNGSGVTTLDVTGVVSDTVTPCGLAKTGDGTLLLRAANTYRGVTTVSNGLLAISHPAALGSTEGSTVVRSLLNARLQLSGTISVAEPLTINGERPNSGYSLISSAGTNVWRGPLTRIGQTRVNVATGSSLTLTGGATGGGGLFVANSYGSLTVSEKPLLIGGDPFWADSSGLTVIAVSGNIWGDTVLGRGTLRTDVPNALPPGTKLKIGLNYAAGGTLDLNGCDQTVGQLLHNTTTAAVRTVTSSAPATLTVNQSASTAFDGRFTGAARLMKTGSGTLTLSATNTTSAGGMTVSNGTLAVTTPTGLGAGPVTLAGGTLRNGQTNAAPLVAASLAWHAGGTFALTLRADGGLCGADVSGALTRGAGDAFCFDFGGGGAAGGTYALLTFGSTDFTASAFRCRNLGTGALSGLRGRFLLEGDTLYLQTTFPAATLLTVR